MSRCVPFRDRLLAGLVPATPGTPNVAGPCLLWQRELDGDGYGRLRYMGRWVRVHRAMFEMFVSLIPAGLEPDHLCRVRRCAAPAHLELVTHKVNMLRGDGIGSENAAKTHCGTCGMPFDEENTYITPSGSRDCRACGRARWRRYYARKKAS